MKGKITQWNTGRGFGFITTDELDDNVFAHIKSFRVHKVDEEIFIGLEVEFDMKETDKGHNAENIRIMGDTNERVY